MIDVQRHEQREGRREMGISEAIYKGNTFNRP